MIRLCKIGAFRTAGCACTLVGLFLSWPYEAACAETAACRPEIAICAETNEASRFLEAARDGDVRELEHLIAQGANVNALDLNGGTALMWASMNGRKEAVKALLDHGADVNIKSEEGHTALSDAVRMGHHDILRLLLSHHAEINSKDVDGRTPLMWAANDGSFEIAKDLVDAGADVNVQDDRGASALMQASFRGDERLVELLLVHHADVNAKDGSGITALFTAVEHGHARIVERLLTHGAQVNVRRELGITPLILAAQQGYPEVVRLLLAHGADMNAKSDLGLSALVVAERKGRYDIVKILKDAGAKLTSPLVRAEAVGEGAEESIKVAVEPSLLKLYIEDAAKRSVLELRSDLFERPLIAMQRAIASTPGFELSSKGFSSIELGTVTAGEGFASLRWREIAQESDLMVWVSSGPDPGEDPVEYGQPRLRITAWKTWQEASSVIDEATINADNFSSILTGKLVKGLEVMKELMVVKADRVADKPQSIVQYTLPAVSGERILVSVDYDAEHRLIQNVDFALMQEKADGEYSYSLPSQEVNHQVLLTCVMKRKELTLVRITTNFKPASSDKLSKVLSVKSEHGHLVDFTFWWQSGDLVNVQVSPKINPYAPLERVTF